MGDGGRDRGRGSVCVCMCEREDGDDIRMLLSSSEILQATLSDRILKRINKKRSRLKYSEIGQRGLPETTRCPDPAEYGKFQNV